MNAQRKYWFPAKKYGWGWSMPITWQGWATLLGYLALVLAGTLFIDPQVNLEGYIVYVAVLSAVLAAICWRTGEPPRWRWGGK
jgi:hypothetical protein